MKTKLYWVALLASASLITQAQAGGQHGGGGHGGSGHAAASGPAPARGGYSASSFHSMPTRNFGSARTIYSGQRFSPVSRQLSSSMAFRQHYYVNSNNGASIRAPQFNRPNINRADRLPRFSNGGNRTNANSRRDGAGAGQVRSRNSLPTNWRNHVVAQHSANWHRDWDRSRDHRWQGHHCRFIDGSWVIFDFGFYPWPYWYPYDYYASDYYADPYGYDTGYDGSGVYQDEEYDDQNGSADQYNDSDSTVAVAQERLARQGYYRGEIDGILGPEMRRAIARYQTNHGLRVTGFLTTETLQALEVRAVASD
ncbi:MAG: hypothetical protein QOH39_3145 [Verrucomicrobiota bacterium]|jgi:hypothetical protein